MIRALLLGIALAGPSTAEELRIGVTANYPPFLFRDEAGQLVGMDADLMAEICARGPFDCAWVELPMPALLDALRQGRVDVVASGIGTNDARERFMDFTCPYYLSDRFTGSFYARDEGTDLSGATIAVGAESLYDRAMRDAGRTTLPFDTEEEALRAVIEGRADAFFGSVQVAPELTARLVFRGEHPIRTLGPALGVGEEDDLLRRRLDAILADLSREGRLAAMQRAWLDTDQGDVIAQCGVEFPQA